MASKLQDELKQQKPFPNKAEEVFLNILRTATALEDSIAKLFKSVELTATQYNVLRILRGAGPEGIPCREISERMITKDSDITRLLDRLEARNLVLRTREKRDRRVIITRITEQGLNLLSQLDEPIEQYHQNNLGHLSAEQLDQLSALLALAREKVK